MAKDRPAYCPHCGEEVLDDGYYCAHCGGELVAVPDSKEHDFGEGSPEVETKDDTGGIGETADVSWQCVDCGQEHIRNNPPCNNCGGMDFKTIENRTERASQPTSDGAGTATAPVQRQPEQAYSPTQQSKWPPNRLAVLGGSGIVALGAFLPWLTASYLGTTYSASGITRDGVLTLSAVVLVAIVVVVTWRQAAKIFALIVGLGILALASVYIVDPFIFTEPPSELSRNVVSPGIGLYLTAFGGLIVGAGSGYALVD